MITNYWGKRCVMLAAFDWLNIQLECLLRSDCAPNHVIDDKDNAALVRGCHKKRDERSANKRLFIWKGPSILNAKQN